MKKIVILAFLFFLQAPNFALAQMTILNVPSGDVAPKNRIFFEHESQFRTKEEGRFYNATNYFTAGIGDNAEFMATYFNLASPASNNQTLALGFKKVFPLKLENIKNYQPKIIIGGASANSIQGNGVGHWAFAATNFLIPQTQTRLTMGVSNGTKQIFNSELTCVMLGFEQKITNKISYVGDWYSGNSNPMGIFASALSFSLPNEVTFFAGYQFANSKRIAQNGFIVEVAKLF